MPIAATLLQSFVSGVFLGSLYALLSMGLALIWGVTDIINISHGATMILGGYFAYSLFEQFGFFSIQSMFIVAIIMGFLGYVLQKFFIAPVTGRLLSTIIVTLGITRLLEGSMQLVWGGDFSAIKKSFMSSFFPYRLSFLNISFPTDRFEVFLLSTILIVLIYIFLKKSTLGKEIRAVSQDKEAAELIGINVKRSFMIAFVIGLGINGLAGALYPMIFPITPGSGTLLLPKAFAITIMVIVTGNMGFAYIGGLIIGVSENIITLFISSGYREIISVVVIVILLLMRPAEKKV